MNEQIIGSNLRPTPPRSDIVGLYDSDPTKETSGVISRKVGKSTTAGISFGVRRECEAQDVVRLDVPRAIHLQSGKNWNLSVDENSLPA